jgi:pyridoxamine 5'-phosphate oxidase
MNRNISDIRREYASKTLKETDVNPDPFQQFKIWFEEATGSNLADPTAMSLATVNSDGRPANRIVLLKGISHEGLTFYTNYESRKGEELKINNHVAATFFWPELERQLRVEGSVSKVDRKESEEYFSTRPRESQIGAWVSRQSKYVSMEELTESFRKQELNWKDKKIDCPPYWGGYLIKPDYFEFWQGRPGRLHDRIAYNLEDNRWKIGRLSP